MRSLLDQMKNLTLLQSDEMEMKPMKISIQDVLNFALDEIKYSAARRDLQLVYAVQDEPIFVNVDPEKTTLAFVNLLNNAIRFSPEGSEILIGAVEQGDKGHGVDTGSRYWASPLINWKRYSKSSIRSNHRIRVVMAGLGSGLRLQRV